MFYSSSPLCINCLPKIWAVDENSKQNMSHGIYLFFMYLKNIPANNQDYFFSFIKQFPQFANSIDYKKKKKRRRTAKKYNIEKLKSTYTEPY